MPHERLYLSNLLLKTLKLLLNFDFTALGGISTAGGWDLQTLPALTKEETVKEICLCQTCGKDFVKYCYHKTINCERCRKLPKIAEQRHRKRYGLVWGIGSRSMAEQLTSIGIGRTP